MRTLLLGAAALILASCSAAQVQTASADLAIACSDAASAGVLASAITKGGAANTAASINQYISAACGTAEAIDKLALNSGSLTWLQGLTAIQKALAAGTAS